MYKNAGSRKIIDLSIVIPTLNEEHFIGRLLDSIIRQTVMPKEVVVVDAYSKDKTIQEIKKRQGKFPKLQYLKIPRKTISCQRNLGAGHTTSPHLLFFDADMELRSVDILENYFKEVLYRKPDIAVAKTPPDSNDWKDLLYFQAEDMLFKLLKNIWPVVTARNLYIRREIFNKARGFDEGLAVGEDQALAYKVVKKGGRLIFLSSVKLHTSVRRVVREGRMKYSIKMILFGLSVMIFGHRRTKVKYEFGNFKKS